MSRLAHALAVAEAAVLALPVGTGEGEPSEDLRLVAYYAVRPPGMPEMPENIEADGGTPVRSS